MNEPLKELVDAVQWVPGRHPDFDSPDFAWPELDWAAVEAALDTALPADFREYVETFPPGIFQTFLRVLHPAEFDSPQALRSTIDFFATIVADGAEKAGREFSVYPEPGGLMPWAVIGSDRIMCWSTTDPDPRRWTVLVCDPVGDGWYPYDGSTVAFLRDFVLGRTGIAALSYVRQVEPTPVFDVAEPVSVTRARLAAQHRPTIIDPDAWVKSAAYVSEMLPPLDAAAELRAALGAGAQLVAATVDWADLRVRLGVPLPADYRSLIDAGTPERVGPVRIARPSNGDGDGDLVTLAGLAYERMRQATGAVPGPRPPYHPEPGGFLPWGTTDSGALVGWCPVGGDPDRWPVAAVGATFRVIATYSMTATRFLLQLVTQPKLIHIP